MRRRLKMKFFKRIQPTEGLIISQVYDQETFYPEFIRDLCKARDQIIIESPFLTTSRYRSLRPHFQRLIQRGVSIRINTRHPNDHDALLATQAWRTISLAKADGVKVMMYSNLLHRKLAVIDQTISWEGSLNILSQSVSAEFMRRIVSPQIALQTLKIVTNKQG